MVCAGLSEATKRYLMAQVGLEEGLQWEGLFYGQLSPRGLGWGGGGVSRLAGGRVACGRAGGRAGMALGGGCLQRVLRRPWSPQFQQGGGSLLPDAVRARCTSCCPPPHASPHDTHPSKPLTTLTHLPHPP